MGGGPFARKAGMVETGNPFWRDYLLQDPGGQSYAAAWQAPRHPPHCWCGDFSCRQPTFCGSADSHLFWGDTGIPGLAPAGITPGWSQEAASFVGFLMAASLVGPTSWPPLQASCGALAGGLPCGASAQSPLRGIRQWHLMLSLSRWPPQGALAHRASACEPPLAASLAGPHLESPLVGPHPAVPFQGLQRTPFLFFAGHQLGASSV